MMGILWKCFSTRKLPNAMKLQIMCMLKGKQRIAKKKRRIRIIRRRRSKEKQEEKRQKDTVKKIEFRTSTKRRIENRNTKIKCNQMNIEINWKKQLPDVGESRSILSTFSSCCFSFVVLFRFVFLATKRSNPRVFLCKLFERELNSK